jgi:hypothetical protein
VNNGNDLQLLAVRFVDPGHPDKDLGPRYRVWVRNNSPRDVDQPFDVTLLASNQSELKGEVVQSGVTVPSINGEDVVAVDVRLPEDANHLVEKDGHQMPFAFLTAVVDAHDEINERSEDNNGATLDRGDIPPVDPAAFSTDVTAAAPGSVVTLAGEGFGPEPGELMVVVGDESEPAQVMGWYELGVQFRMPNLHVRNPEDAQILVVRADGAASNPVVMDVAPESMIGELPDAPQPR